MTSVKDIKTAEQRMEGGSYLGTGTFVSGSDSVKTGYAGSAAQIAARNAEIADLRAYAEQLEREMDELKQRLSPQPVGAVVAAKYEIVNALGCFKAAYVEGLQGALAGTSDVKLKDLIERRILFAMGHINSAIFHIDAALAAQTPAQQSGWKMVPLEPTDDMVVAFSESWFSKVRCIDDPEMGDAYAAMLAAAPSPAQ